MLNKRELSSGELVILKVFKWLIRLILLGLLFVGAVGYSPMVTVWAVLIILYEFKVLGNRNYKFEQVQEVEEIKINN